jgi:TPR repeat protein
VSWRNDDKHFFHLETDCDAQYRVGLVYFMGIDKPHDFKDAHKLWLKAAKGNQRVGVHLDTRISTAFISFSVSCASVS